MPPNPFHTQTQRYTHLEAFHPVKLAKPSLGTSIPLRSKKRSERERRQGRPAPCGSVCDLSLIACLARTPLKEASSWHCWSRATTKCWSPPPPPRRPLPRPSSGSHRHHLPPPPASPSSSRPPPSARGALPARRVRTFDHIVPPCMIYR
jgi:hypothetical protein